MQCVGCMSPRTGKYGGVFMADMNTDELPYYIRGALMYDMKTDEIIAVYDGHRWVAEIGLSARESRAAGVGVERENQILQDEATKELQRLRDMIAPVPLAPPVPADAPSAAKQGELDPKRIDFDNFLDSNEKSVNSTNLESVNWDAITMTLRVSFRRGHGYYYYGDVSYSEYQSLLLAPSVGKYFNERIKTSKPIFHR